MLCPSAEFLSLFVCFFALVVVVVVVVVVVLEEQLMA